MNTSKLDAALKKYAAARQAAILSGVPAQKLDGSLISGTTTAILRYNRATQSVDRASKAAYSTHIR